MLGLTFLVQVLAVMCAVQSAEGDPITSWGQAVSAIGSDLGVGLPLESLDATPDGANNPTPNWIKFFIPLTETASGTYGVNGVGMSADSTSSGCGPGTPKACGYLDIFLRFSPAAVPSQNWVLSMQFVDLDLASINDPASFFESAQFYSGGGQAVSPEFTNIAGHGSTNGVNWNVYQPAGSGADWPVNIDFSGQGLADLITDPFWMRVTLRTSPFIVAGINTPEYLRASLATVPVPEPSSLLLFGAGLLALSFAKRRGNTSRR